MRSGNKRGAQRPVAAIIWPVVEGKSKMRFLPRLFCLFALPVLAGGAAQTGDSSESDAKTAVATADKALEAAKGAGDAIDIADAEEKLRRAKAFSDLF